MDCAQKKGRRLKRKVCGSCETNVLCVALHTEIPLHAMRCCLELCPTNITLAPI